MTFAVSSSSLTAQTGATCGVLLGQVTAKGTVNVQRLFQSVCKP